MKGIEYLFLVLAVASTSEAVKINMQGSVKLGKDVMETISHYLKKKGVVAQRRSGISIKPFHERASEQIKWTIDSANIGRGLKIFTPPLGALIKEYIVLLASAIESVFDGILTQDSEREAKGAIILEKLKLICPDIHEVLKDANYMIVEEKKTFEWITILKRISARYQKAVVEFVETRLDGDPQDILNVKRKLTQKLTIAIILVENKYEKKLCIEHNICEEENVVTKNLQNLLSTLDGANNTIDMEFIKYFYENMPEDLLTFLSPDTMHEFQVILSDLSYTKDAPTKEVLSSVHKAVVARLKYVEENVEISKGYDQQLVHIILSDMDYFYHTFHKTYPFDYFLGQFTGWMRNGGKLGPYLQTVIKELKEKLRNQRPDLIEKLKNECRVFLELTVDPEK